MITDRFCLSPIFRDVIIGISFLMAVSSCSDEQIKAGGSTATTTIYDYTSDCGKNQTVNSTSSPLPIDSIVFELDSTKVARYNKNIPPLYYQGSFFFISEPNLLIRVSPDTVNRFTMDSVIRLPRKFQTIDDFLITENGIYYTANVDSSAIIKFNPSNGLVDTMLLSPGFIWESVPFLGNKLYEISNGFLLPFTRTATHLSRSPILSHFDENFTLKEQIGEGRNYGHEYLEPYFSVPVLTIVHDTIFATYSMNRGVTSFKYHKGQLKYLSTICFLPIQREGNEKMVHKDSLLDFSTITESYVKLAYCVQLNKIGDKLIKTIKGRQEIHKPESRMLNTLIDAPWKLEIYDMKKQTLSTINFREGRYDFVNTISYNNQLYFLKRQENKNQLVFHSFNLH